LFKGERAEQSSRGASERSAQILAVHGGHGRRGALDKRESPAAERSRPVGRRAASEDLLPQAAHSRGRNERPQEQPVRLYCRQWPTANRRRQLQARRGQRATGGYRREVGLPR